MITQELIDTVKTGLAAGTDTEAVKSELRNKGYANDEIDQAFINAKKEMSENSDQGIAWHLTRKEVYIGLATLLILASAILIFYFSHHNGGFVSGSIVR
jgi:hypothetical protein